MEKLNYEKCCGTCEYSISDELICQIMEQESDCQYMSEEQLFDSVGHCELSVDINVAAENNYCCNNYELKEDYKVLCRK